MKKTFFPFLAIAIFFSACNGSKDKSGTQTTGGNSATDTGAQAAAVAAIKTADSTWSTVSEKRSVEGWLNYYSTDAIMMPPGEKVCNDPASREASIRNMFATPGIDLTFWDTKVEASTAGDMGYASGLYKMTYKGPKGEDLLENGKFTEVWKKQSDGGWKCVADIWNADPAGK
jgi:ketosteroid isomerase-like protein